MNSNITPTNTPNSPKAEPMRKKTKIIKTVDLQAEIEKLKAEKEAMAKELEAARRGGQGRHTRKNNSNTATAIYKRDSERIAKKDFEGLTHITHTVNLGGGKTNVWTLEWNKLYETWEVVKSDNNYELGAPVPMLRENHKSLQAISTAHILRCYEAGWKHLCLTTCDKPIKDKKIIATLQAKGLPIPQVGDEWDCYGTVKAGKANSALNWTFVGDGWGSA